MGPSTPGIGLGGLVPPSPVPCETIPPLPCTNDDFGDFRRLGPRMDTSDLVYTPYPIVASAAVEELAAGPPRSPPAGPRLARELAAGRPRSPPAGPRFAQDLPAGPPRRLPASPRFAQDLTDDWLRNAFVGHFCILDPIAESPSSSENVAVTAGAPAGVAFRLPFVSPSPTLGVSLSTFLLVPLRA